MFSIEEKKSVVNDFTELIKDSSGIYLADFSGINVEKITELRAAFREKGIKMQVVKNTLLKRVFDDCQIKGLDDYLVGPTSVILANSEDPIDPAKEIVAFHKKNKDLLSIKAVSMEGTVYEGKSIKELADMPGRQELVAQVIGIATGAGANLIGLIKGPGSKIAGQVKALIERLDEKGNN